jgi:hypothetical protein
MPSIDSVITTSWRSGRLPFIPPAIVEICNKFGPIYYLWGPGREGTTGHHNQGRAVDVSILDKGSGPKSTWISRPGPARKVLGDQVAHYALTNRARLNIDRDGGYIIWNRRIASAKRVVIDGKTYAPWTWRPYTGSNPHTDHVHISFATTGAYKPPTVVRPPEGETVTQAQFIAFFKAALQDPEIRRELGEVVLDETFLEYPPGTGAGGERLIFPIRHFIVRADQQARLAAAQELPTAEQRSVQPD